MGSNGMSVLFLKWIAVWVCMFFTSLDMFEMCHFRETQLFAGICNFDIHFKISVIPFILDTKYKDYYS